MSLWHTSRTTFVVALNSYIHTYARTNIHECTRTYIHTSKQTACMHIYICIYIHTYTHIYRCALQYLATGSVHNDSIKIILHSKVIRITRDIHRALVRSGCGEERKKKWVFTAKLYASRAICTGLLSVLAAGEKKGKKIVSHSKVIRITLDIYRALVCSGCGRKKRRRNQFSKQNYTHHARCLQGSYPFQLRGEKRGKNSFLTAKLYASRAISTGLLSVPAAGIKTHQKMLYSKNIDKLIERHHERNGRCIPQLCAFIIMGWLRLVGSFKLKVSFAE